MKHPREDESSVTSASSSGAVASRPGDASESALAWTLTVAGLVCALALSLYAAFLDPSIVRNTGGAPSHPLTLPPHERVSFAATETLGADDVRGVLADLDYRPSEESSRAAYDEATRRLIRSVDLEAFMVATLQATPSVAWTALGDATPTAVSGAAKTQLVAEAAYRWGLTRQQSDDDEGPLANVYAATLFPPVQAHRNRFDSVCAVQAQGLAPLGLLFGAHEPDLGWDWEVTDIAVTGTDTAKVVFQANSTPDAGWSFANPSARYIKELKFGRDATGKWRLCAWPNYWDVERRFRRNLRPIDAQVRLDRWWGAL